MGVLKTHFKWTRVLVASCLVLCFGSGFELVMGGETDECVIEGIPRKIAAYIARSPQLKDQSISAKWIALDHVISKQDRVLAYDCISTAMHTAYKKSKLDVTFDYRNWIKVNANSFYAPANEFGWANVFVNKKAKKYMVNKYVSDFAKGITIVKESFVFDTNGKVSPGPLFYMVKMGKGFNEISNDWKFFEVDLNGNFVTTNHSDPSATGRCIKCHSKRKNHDFLYFINTQRGADKFS